MLTYLDRINNLAEDIMMAAKFLEKDVKLRCSARMIVGTGRMRTGEFEKDFASFCGSVAPAA